VPVGASAAEPSSEADTESESPTTKIPVTKELPTNKIPVAEEPPAPKSPAAEKSSTTKIPVVPFAPYGSGSARADNDGGGPSGWLVKGRSDTRLYHTPDDSDYDETTAQVWFRDEESAASAYFTPRRNSKRK
jgi:uncharacterized membrane protein ArfC